MSTIVSKATLTDMPDGFWNTNTDLFGVGYSRYSLDYQAMYERHMNVKICVDFLARNMAHLGLHVYTRDANNNRKRERDHQSAKLLKNPLPPANKSSRYKLLESVFSDMFISGNGYILKLRNTEKHIIGLLRLPYMNVNVKGVLVPSEYTVTYIDGEKKYKPNDIIHFRTYAVSNNTRGISPLEGLREVLAEEAQNVKYSAQFWKNAAKIGGVIERPVEAGDWGVDARKRFREEWQSMYAGETNSGKTAILEEGMTFKPITYSPKDTLYIDSRKLTREECARAFHIPPPLVGILDRATFSNISEQHKSLYRDVLGPLCASIEADFNTQYLSEFPDLKDAYVEFNIEEKLQGDFQQQAESFRQAVGTPWMTPNEARSLMNLPKLDDESADQIATPLNMLLPNAVIEPNDGKGFAGCTVHSAPHTEYEQKDMKADDEGEIVEPDFPEIVEAYLEKWQVLLTKTFIRQRDSLLPKAKSFGRFDQLHLLFDRERWNREMTEDFIALTQETAIAFGRAWSEKIGTQYDDEMLSEWMATNGRIAAETLNNKIFEELQAAMATNEPVDAVKRVFELALAVTVAKFAQSRMTGIENKVELEIVVESPVFATKIWRTTSPNPRPSHRAVNGQEVDKKGYFSNGLYRPGDYKASVDEVAGCRCKMVYRKKKK
jgi:HK97 family phage portal protein